MQTVQLLISGHGTSTRAEMKKRLDESKEYLEGIEQENTRQLEDV
ncbi:hypothetical protein [Alkalihalobacillus pseudalcaliphilus]|nr:hypothetical protein [Alkalihalobacillus pseudalcaliphilus]